MAETASKDDRLCPWNDHGYVCGLVGSITDSTLGYGPWYCPEHWWLRKGERSVFDPIRKTPAEIEVAWLTEAKNFSHDHGLDTIEKKRAFVRASIRKIAAGNIVRDKAHWQRWAEETLARTDACGGALEAARKFLHENPAREPGDDDEEVAA